MVRYIDINLSDLFFNKDIYINDKLSIHCPTIREVINYGERKYWSVIYCLTANSYDFRVEFYDAGKDYETISDYEVFIDVLLNVLSPEDYSFVFNGLKFDKNCLYKHKETNDLVISDGNVIIDRAIHSRISKVLKSMHYIKKEFKRGGNAHTKKYLIEKEKKRREVEQRLQAMKNKDINFKSELFNYITVVLSKTSIWNSETIQDASLFAVMTIAKRLMKEKEFDNTMTGLYSGSIDGKKISLNKIHWTSDLTD